MRIQDMSNDQYGLLFDVRRSIRYHTQRNAFFRSVTRSLCIVIGVVSILSFWRANPSEGLEWPAVLIGGAAALAVLYCMFRCSLLALQHHQLRQRFTALEIAILMEDASEQVWTRHHVQRLLIEQQEPSVYRMLDLLCYKEQLLAEGLQEEATKIRLGYWQYVTRHILVWQGFDAS